MKSFFITLSFFITTALFSQSITNTLGTNGFFTINDTSNNFLTLNQSTGEVNILNSLRMEITTSSSVGVIYQNAHRFLHTYGFQNTFLGVKSGNFTLASAFSTGIGQNSLMSLTTGYNNTAVGNASLITNTTGANNSSLGTSSLLTNTSGSNNTALGWRTLYFNILGSNNSAVGVYSLYSSLGDNNTAVGRSSLYSNTSGTGNTALGYMAGYDNLTGSNLTLIGYDAQPSTGSATNEITLGDANISILRCNTQTITSLSDARDKKNIKELSLGLDFLMKVKPRQFNWDKREWYEGNKSDGSKMKETPTAGFISQELDEVQTNENADWLNLVLKDNPEKLEATYGNLLPVMVKAIQELKVEGEKLKVENFKLQSENEKLISDVESLKLMNSKIVKLEKMLNELTAVKQSSFNKEEVNLINSK